MNVTCPNCATIYRVDPAKVPEAGVRARCNVCSAVFAVRRESDPKAPGPAPQAAAPKPQALESASPVAKEPVQTPLPRAEPPRVATPVAPPRPAAAPGPAAPFGGAPRPAAPRPAAPAPPAGAHPSIPRAAPAGTFAPASPAAAAGSPRPVASPPSAPPAQPAAPRPAAPAAPAPANVPPRPAPSGGGRPANPFLSQDPALKARRLARALISDMVVYHPGKRQEGLRDGNLKELFEEEIKKSWEEYAEQVGREVAESTAYFREALNEILAGGRQVF
jgi:predicted Zn finger-like uncharacterized protein